MTKTDRLGNITGTVALYRLGCSMLDPDLIFALYVVPAALQGGAKFITTSEHNDKERIVSVQQLCVSI